MTQLAAREVMVPEINALRAQNQQLRGIAQRNMHAEIERALDSQVPNWREVYADSQFADWLALPDRYSGGIRSQLMRHAVAVGDAARVVRFYQGFISEHGVSFDQRSGGARGYPRGSSPRSGAPSGKIYNRAEIKRLYEERRAGRIPDNKWGPLEADLVRAGAEGRVVGALDLRDGTQMSMLK
jgi:hypothetical protein